MLVLVPSQELGQMHIFIVLFYYLNKIKMSHGFLGKSVAIHKNDQNDSVSTLGCGHEPVLTGFEAGFSKQSFLDSRKKI